MINTVKPLDTAASTQPTTTAPRATRMTGRWRGPSASRPITGVARAPVSKVMVRIHSPVLSDTPSSRARVGMRGAPRLDTTAIKDPDSTRVGTRSRRRSEGTSPAPIGSGEPIPGGLAVAVMEVLPHSSSDDVTG